MAHDDCFEAKKIFNFLQKTLKNCTLIYLKQVVNTQSKAFKNFERYKFG